MDEHLNNIINRLSRLYDVSISRDYIPMLGIYRIDVRHMSSNRVFVSQVYIEPIDIRQFNEYTIVELIENEGIWPVIKKYKHLMYEHIKPITIE